MDRPVRPTTALALTLLLTLGLAACSDDDGGDEAAPAESSTQSIVPATIKPTTPQREIPAESEIVEVPALRETIALTGCEAAGDGWAGSGTAQNVSDETKTFHILVFFTDEYSRTIDYAETDVEVAAGKSADWTAETDFDPPQGTQCVLRGLSQTPA